ncbi:MAG: NACHT domain-containing protein [Tildeniella nuda ZEHNDER 1965/U140]|jgi:AAA+ ATPase superfamily predicted ATPase|nr:NACHT domain-containing protein [Tildeniella nuda ZEHNDER 1965/U140]
MNADEALKFVEQLLLEREKRLNDLQRVMFRGAWEGKSSKKIYQECSSRCTYQHLIQNVGPELWRLLSDVVGDRVSKRNLQGPIERMRERRSHLEPNGRAVLSEQSPAEPGLRAEPEPNPFWDERKPQREDWGDIPAVSSVFGRIKELQQLEERVRINGCRLLVLFGSPGIGKTTLAAKLVHEVRDQFDYFIWRSLERSPSLQALTAELCHFLSDGEDSSTDLARLLYYLRNRPCLIVLDGLESVLRGGVHNGSYRDGYENYGELLKAIGQTGHQSCFVFTSAEKPKDVANMEGSQRVFALKLDGLGELAAREFLTAKGAFSCADSDWRLIIQRYEGNPSALNAIATNVREVFDGDVKHFLEQLQQGSALFEDIRSLLDRQFNRLSDLERDIVECLVTRHEPLTITEILQFVTHPISTVEVQEVLQSLFRRSLIEGSAAGYSLQTLMTEYVMHRGLK